jgi:hypothetical protein
VEEDALLPIERRAEVAAASAREPEAVPPAATTPADRPGVIFAPSYEFNGGAGS